MQLNLDFDGRKATPAGIELQKAIEWHNKNLDWFRSIISIVKKRYSNGNDIRVCSMKYLYEVSRYDLGFGKRKLQNTYTPITTRLLLDLYPELEPVFFTNGKTSGRVAKYDGCERPRLNGCWNCGACHEGSLEQEINEMKFRGVGCSKWSAL